MWKFLNNISTGSLEKSNMVENRVEKLIYFTIGSFRYIKIQLDNEAERTQTKERINTRKSDKGNIIEWTLKKIIAWILASPLSLTPERE